MIIFQDYYLKIPIYHVKSKHGESEETSVNNT